MKVYTINEIFYSLQGEGMRAGTANFFLRFTGCNQTCKVETHGFDCDTEFASGRQMKPDEIVDYCRKLSPSCRWIICTGGEPLLQLDSYLIDYLHDAGFAIAVETNGSIEVPMHSVVPEKILPDIKLEDRLSFYRVDWITVSPKVAEHAIRQKCAHEVKYVRAHGQGIPKTVVKAQHQLLSPAFNGLELDRGSLAWCIQLAKENPDWRLSVQQHKNWRVR